MHISVCIDTILIHITSDKKTMSSNGIRDNIAHGTEENMNFMFTFSSVQFSRSVVSNSLWPHGLQTSLSITNSRSLPKLISNKSVMPSNQLILRHSLLLLPSIFTSITVFSKESVLPIRWPKYCSFSFSISTSREYSGLISFRIDWFDLLDLKSLLQHHSSKASVAGRSVFFMLQLTSMHDYWKNHNFD